MDQKSLTLLIAIPVFFALLHLMVLPLLRRVSIAVQGEPFTYRLKSWERSGSGEHIAKWDILWSATAVMLAMVAAGGVIVVLVYLGIIPAQ